MLQRELQHAPLGPSYPRPSCLRGKAGARAVAMAAGRRTGPTLALGVAGLSALGSRRRGLTLARCSSTYDVIAVAAAAFAVGAGLQLGSHCDGGIRGY